MTRLLRTQRRQIQRAHSCLLILTVLILSACARVAAAATPTYQGNFTSPGLCSPRGIDLLPSGQVIVGSDCLASYLALYTPAGGLVDEWRLPQGFDGAPNGVAVDGSGNVFVTDTNGSRVHKVTGDLLSTGSWSTAVAPTDLAVNGSGEVFVSSLDGQRVQRFTNSGVLLGTIGGPGSGPGQYLQPLGLGRDASGRLYVADAGRVRVLRFHSTGIFDMEFATPAPPHDVAVGPDGNIYVITATNNVVHQYSPGGALLQSFGSPAGLDLPWRIAISSSGAIYVTEQYNHRVTKFQIDAPVSASRMSFGRLKSLYR